MARLGLWRPALFILAWSVSSNGQVRPILLSGEKLFTVTVKGTDGLMFDGSSLVSGVNGELKEKPLRGRVPEEFELQGATAVVLFQKRAKDGDLTVDISNNGTTIKHQSTNAPFGVVSLASVMPPWGAPRRLEFRVDGTVKFAFLTMTSETGDIEQRLVSVPFSQTVFTKAGWIIVLSARKTRVERIDPLHSDGRLEVQDDGVHGSVHAAILVNGAKIGEAEASEPYGTANAKGRVP